MIGPMPHGLSFSSDFFRSDDAEAAAGGRPTSVEEAVRQLSNDAWAAIAEEVFGVDPSQLDIETVLRRIQETNTCGNLDPPVEVFIDPEGEFSVLVYEPEMPWTD
jgi:hypothetical protein